MTMLNINAVSAGDMPIASKFSVRPIGNKKAKCMAEEEKILSNVTEKLKSTLIPATTSTATSAALAGALHKVTHVIATGIKEWSVRQAYSNASPTLKRHYDSLLLKLRIRELESKLQKMLHCFPKPSTIGAKLFISAFKWK